MRPMTPIRESALRLKSKFENQPWFDQMATGLARGEEAIIIFAHDLYEAKRKVPPRWEGFLVVTTKAYQGGTLSGKVARRWLEKLK